MIKEREEITGIIIGVSDSKLYRDYRKTPKSGYHHILIKQHDGTKVRVYLSDQSLGIQKFEKSVVYFINNNTGEMVKTGIVNPKRFVGTKVSVTGMIDKSQDPPYMNKVSEFVLLDRE